MSKFEARSPKLETNTMKAQSEIRSSNKENPEHKTELNRSEFLAFSRFKFIWMLFVSDFVLRIRNLFGGCFGLAIRNSYLSAGLPRASVNPEGHGGGPWRPHPEMVPHQARRMPSAILPS